MIVEATVNDNSILTEVALQSKAFWGYSKQYLQSWEKDLTVTSTMIQNLFVFKYLHDNEIVGFYILNTIKQNSVELQFLFVKPEFIGNAIGSKLLQHAFEIAKNNGSKIMTLLADPNAIQFYEKNGFEIIAKKESSIKGRYLPIMQKQLI